MFQGLGDWHCEKALIMKEQADMLASSEAGKTDTESSAVEVGQVWERRNGSRITIERVDRGYADYWLATGSKPQFRSIALENFKRYRRIL